jgi:hypothetical protein
MEAFIEASRSKPQSFGEQLVQGAAFTGAMSVAAPVVGVPMALVGAGVASKKIAGMVFGRLGKAGDAAAQRMAGALERVVKAAETSTRYAPVTAVKALERSMFAPPEDKKPPAKVKGRGRLVAAFRAREKEIRSQTTPGPDGKATMRPHARQEMAERLSPVRALSPGLADKMETAANRRIGYLADRLPKRPDLPGRDMGPDTWRPSDYAIRNFARAVRAVEDPAGIVERAANLTATPQDGDALREVYPEMFAELQQWLAENLPELRKRLPYKQRLMLSMLTGVPMDPALDPRILRRLQAHFAEEPGTSGGFEPPRAKPQFGSVRRPDPTPAQERAEG